MKTSKLLRENGLKATPQRRAVYTTLSRLCHASVEQIAAAVALEYPNITVSTVYNVLDSFANKGIISKISTPSKKMYYDICAAEHFHIVEKDNTITDFNDTQLSKIIHQHLQEHPIEGYDIEKISLQIYANKLTN